MTHTINHRRETRNAGDEAREHEVYVYPEHCEDCGEALEGPLAEIVRKGEVLIVHAECMREGDELA